MRVDDKQYTESQITFQTEGSFSEFCELGGVVRREMEAKERVEGFSGLHSDTLRGDACLELLNHSERWHDATGKVYVRKASLVVIDAKVSDLLCVVISQCGTVQGSVDIGDSTEPYGSSPFGIFIILLQKVHQGSANACGYTDGAVPILIR